MLAFVRYVFVPALVCGAVGLAVMLLGQLYEPAGKPGYASAVKRAAPGV
jgi:hypothetical protein